LNTELQLTDIISIDDAVPETLITTVMTKKRFSIMVEKKAQQYSMQYIDAVLAVCEDRELQPEDVARLLNVTIKDKIEAEALMTNSIKGDSTQLPI